MKQVQQGYHKLSGSFILVCFIVFFSSCNTYNFSDPQPVDKENIYEFPAEFCGKWVAVDTFVDSFSFTIPLQEKQGYQFFSDDIRPSGIYKEEAFSAGRSPGNETEGEYYYVDKKYLLLIGQDSERIIKGAWPRLTEKGEFLNPPGFDGSLKKIIYDSLKRPVDTITNYLFRGKNIYEIISERFLKKGYPYYTLRDTIIVLKKDTLCIDLGQNAFLRQVNKNLFVLNIRNKAHGVYSDELDDWWQLELLELAGNNSIRIWDCTSKSGDIPCMFYDKDIKRNIFYFDCKWTSDDLLHLIKEGYFEISSTLYRK